VTPLRPARLIAAAGLALALLPMAVPADAGNRSSAAQPQQLNTLREVFAALQACWVPPPVDHAHEGMQITVMFSFTRAGALFGEPRFTYMTPGVREDVRVAYQKAVAATLDRCLPLPFTPGLGGAVAGRQFTIRFVDNRSPPGART
jgi:hypothetical protein